jgi:hypothetical protein
MQPASVGNSRSISAPHSCTLHPQASALTSGIACARSVTIGCTSDAQRQVPCPSGAALGCSMLCSFCHVASHRNLCCCLAVVHHTWPPITVEHSQESGCFTIEEHRKFMSAVWFAERSGLMFLDVSALTCYLDLADAQATVATYHYGHCRALYLTLPAPSKRSCLTWRGSDCHVITLQSRLVGGTAYILMAASVPCAPWECSPR